MQQWQDILIDFIINLSNSNDYMNIMIIIDQLTKMRHIISLKSLNIVKIAEIFTWNVFKLHELLNTIIFDCENQFIIIFWKILYTWLEIDSWFSTVFYSETDDQTENVNVIMKQYLQIYCLYLQNDWERWLFLAEFIMNNMINKSIDMILFYMIYRQNS